MRNLTHAVSFESTPYTASATTTITTDPIDVSGFPAYVVIATLAVAADNTITIQGTDDPDDLSSFADLEGATINPTSDGITVLIEVWENRHEAIRLVFTRNTATAVFPSIVAKQGARRLPVQQSTTIETPLFLRAPEQVPS